MRMLTYKKSSFIIIGIFVFIVMITAVFFVVQAAVYFNDTVYFTDTTTAREDTSKSSVFPGYPSSVMGPDKNTNNTFGNSSSNASNNTSKSFVSSSPNAPVPNSSSKSNGGNNNIQWGVYSGWKEQDIAAFEQMAGHPDIIATFVHFGNENAFPNEIGSVVKGNRQTLAIFWEATNYTIKSTSQPKFSYDAILRGDWDVYMKSFAKDAKTYGGPIILVPFSEMNGNWYPWSGTENGNTPEKAVLAYRHVHELFSDVPNVKFGWAVNHESVPDVSENAITAYYPGDAYVDYVGVDGFNFGGGQEQSFNEIFGNALAVLSQYNKPIYIFSVASAENANKAAWIADAFSVQIPKHPKIAGWIWFNEKKEKDWRIDSNKNALSAFKKILPAR